MNVQKEVNILEEKVKENFTTKELFKMFIKSFVCDVKRYIKSKIFDVKKHVKSKFQIKKEKYIISIIIITIMSLLICNCIKCKRSYCINNFKKVKVTIGMDKGYLTVWEAQKKLTPNKNLNRMIWLDEEINDKNLNNLKVGEEVYLLEEK